jgi:hypothetical protein
MNRRFVMLIVALIVLPLLLLGGYFAVLVYRPFEQRTIAPAVLIEEYDGPGSLKKARERDAAQAAAADKSNPDGQEPNR